MKIYAQRLMSAFGTKRTSDKTTTRLQLSPVILGPKGRYYVIDHHHLARALHEDVKQIRFKAVDNYARRCESVRSCWHGRPASFAILYQNTGPWTVGVANLIDQ